MSGRLIFVLVIGVWALAPVCGRAEGWKMPSLNPFKKKTSHPAHLRFADEEPKSAWWKPKLPSMSAAKSRTSNQQPSTWRKMTSGTKAAWTKTTDVLNPFDDEQDKPKDITGYNTAFTQSSARQKPEKKSAWWPSWSAEEEKRPQTVQDFLGQERPDY